MTFFASNLIILISGALLVGFVIRMMAMGRAELGVEDTEGAKRDVGIESEEKEKRQD